MNPIKIRVNGIITHDAFKNEEIKKLEEPILEVD